MEPLLDVKGLKTYFFTEAGIVKAVDGVDFKVEKDETVGLVGESGSGKTVTSLSIMRIVPQPGRILAGSIMFEGEDLLAKSEDEMRKIRGAKIAMTFQDPTTSLNPLYTIGSQLAEVIREHNKDLSKKQVTEQVIKLLEMVRISEPELRIKAYPHELSGGMKQRIAIARALACGPSLLFADEPTTNLDVTVQAQVLSLLKDLRQKEKMSLVMITHDMGIVAEVTQRVQVLYAGMVAEVADTRSLFKKPSHPYTEALLQAVPRIDQRKDLKVIPGNIPNLIDPPSGCRFHPRCPYAQEICTKKVPPLEVTDNGHLVACHFWRNLSLAGA
ncbi:ABC transporter ATP-binding protein [Candidatus Bathyarchaeota archaeon]|nr:ABC transporter ATP-binding protein [Candidatus Bathyarchaeota archaeon]